MRFLLLEPLYDLLLAFLPFASHAKGIVLLGICLHGSRLVVLTCEKLEERLTTFLPSLSDESCSARSTC